MNKGYDIQEELESISSYLAAIPRTMPYTVPDGYFEHFGVPVNEHVTAHWSKALPYTVPQGYFETLTDNIVAQAIGTVNIPSTSLPYAAPAGYFEALPEQVLRTVNELDNDSHKAKIIPIKQRSVKPIRWAAAAIVMLFIGIGSYFTIFNVQQDMGTDNLLASIPNSEIQDYVQGAYRVDVNRIVSNNDDINDLPLDNSDIITFLDETGWD